MAERRAQERVVKIEAQAPTTTSADTSLLAEVLADVELTPVGKDPRRVDDITKFSTAELLAELDRRARAAAPPKVLFHGVWPGEPGGHYNHDRYGNRVYPGPKFASKDWELPWDNRGNARPQEQGLFWHHYDNGRTVLVSWDRSADNRGGCVASFVVDALVSPERALTLARESYPRVFARIEQHIGRAVKLAGPVEC